MIDQALIFEASQASYFAAAQALLHEPAAFCHFPRVEAYEIDDVTAEQIEQSEEDDIEEFTVPVAGQANATGFVLPTAGLTAGML